MSPLITRSCGLAAKAALLQGADRWFESTQDYFGDAQIRQPAERLGLNPSDCRFDSCSGYWLGRQMADHPGLDPGMLWVRPPPEPLEINTSSQSSQECSPPCHGGDRGFKSHRGRLTTWRGTPTGRAAKLKPWCLWVRLPPVLLGKHASVGHWQAPLAVNQSSHGTLAVQLRPGAL